MGSAGTCAEHGSMLGAETVEDRTHAARMEACQGRGGGGGKGTLSLCKVEGFVQERQHDQAAAAVILVEG